MTVELKRKCNRDEKEDIVRRVNNGENVKALIKEYAKADDGRQYLRITEKSLYRWAQQERENQEISDQERIAQLEAELEEVKSKLIDTEKKLARFERRLSVERNL